MVFICAFVLFRPSLPRVIEAASKRRLSPPTVSADGLTRLHHLRGKLLLPAELNQNFGEDRAFGGVDFARGREGIFAQPQPARENSGQEAKNSCFHAARDGF